MQATATREFTTTKFNHLSAKTVIREQQILEPDNDLRRAITFDELLERTYEDIHQMFNNK